MKSNNPAALYEFITALSDAEIDLVCIKHPNVRRLDMPADSEKKDYFNALINRVPSLKELWDKVDKSVIDEKLQSADRRFGTLMKEVHKLSLDFEKTD